MPDSPKTSASELNIPSRSIDYDDEGPTTKYPRRTPCSDLLNVSLSAADVPTSSDAGYETPGFDNRPHAFVVKRNFLRVTCAVCEKTINFSVMAAKCRRCKGSFHEGCRMKAELPCIARKETPKSQSSKGRRLRLGDFCPDSRPMVPPLIAYCTLHLDRNPSSDNPYNGEGVKSEMEDILRIFQKTRAFPKLDRYSHHSVAGAIKMFLSQIREPVIPSTYTKQFFIAAKCGKADQLEKMVRDLPTAHMDTLACVCRHWNKYSNSCSDDLISTILAPYVFRTDAASELSTPCLALKALIELPNSFWSGIINFDALSSEASRCNTPISRNPSNASTSSMLSITKQRPELRITRSRMSIISQTSTTDSGEGADD
ncbi:rhoGAP domain-containing protein [Ditylenchus destructor]|nr:rhoGAP domain-containing protein [Ditylenchus destructor]